jgi:hypothetical protein
MVTKIPLRITMESQKQEANESLKGRVSMHLLGVH